MAALEITQKCRSCGESHSFSFNGIINVAGNPELRERVARGDYFTWECPCCGARNLVASQTCLYHDAEEKLIIVLAPAGLKMEQLPQGYTCRLVDSVGQLMEKVKIFSAGLDDVIVELCKYITRGELKKDVDLKFVGTGGPDGELTFTYPQDGDMQMLVVGFNVYEDCAGIVSRSPEIRSAASGPVRVDKEWIGQFFA